MRVKKLGYLREKIRNQALKLYKLIENNENSNPAKNGEIAFLRAFFDGRSGQSGLTIFDCGANRGEWTASCLERLGGRPSTIHLFEPTTACCEILRTRYANAPQVRINSVGVSDSPEDHVIYSDAAGSSLASLYRRRISDTLTLEKEEVVHLVRLDQYVAQAGIHHVDFLKLDVEGHELKALAGLGTFLDPGKIDAIQFEYGGANIDSGSRLSDLFSLLGSHGFVVCKIMPHHIEAREYAPSMENFMYSNYVALSPARLRP